MHAVERRCTHKHDPMPENPSHPNQLSLGARWSITFISVGVTSSSSFLFINSVAFMISAFVAARGNLVGRR